MWAKRYLESLQLDFIIDIRYLHQYLQRRMLVTLNYTLSLKDIHIMKCNSNIQSLKNAIK